MGRCRRSWALVRGVVLGRVRRWWGGAGSGGLSDAPQIPARFRSFLWIPEKLILAETSAKITIPVVTNSGGIHSFRN